MRSLQLNNVIDSESINLRFCWLTIGLIVQLNNVISLSWLQDKLPAIGMTTWEGKLLLWESRNIVACILLGMLIKICALQPFLYRVVCVGWLLVMSLSSRSRKELPLLSRLISSFVHKKIIIWEFSFSFFVFVLSIYLKQCEQEVYWCY